MEYQQVPQIKINVMEINTDTVLPKKKKKRKLFTVFFAVIKFYLLISLFHSYNFYLVEMTMIVVKYC